MTQKTDPFIQLNWGWDTGEGGWGEGMNQNLIIHAFLQNKRINNILASASLLPAMPVDGDSYFAVADKTLYIRAEGSWYTLQPTVGMVFILKTTEAVMKYDGTTLVSDTKTISEVVGLQTALDAKVSTSLVGAVSGVAPLGVDGKVPAGYLPASGSYLGVWNATTNTPTITSGVGSSGEFYKVSVGGSINIDGTSSWSIGDEIRFNGTVWQRIPNTSAVSSVNGYTGSVVLTATDVGAATTSHSHSNATTSVAGFMSTSDKTKLDGVATGATANSPDATLLARANHTGTQAQSTVTNLTTDLASKQATLVNTVNIKSVNGTSLLGSGDLTISTGGSTTFTGLTDTPASYTGNALKATRVNVGETALEFVSLGSAAYSNSGDFAASSHTHPDATTSLSGFMSATDKTKLNGVATGATVNLNDATLLARANHTGTQTSSTISDFNTATDARVVAGITGKENTIVAGTTSQYWRGDKSFQTLDKSAVGLSNVDNTSDATKNSASVTLTNKTISGASNTLSNIAQSSVTSLVTDLGLKAPLASPIFSGTVSLPFNTSVGSVGGTEISYLSGVSSGIQSQLNGKQASLGYTPVNKAGDTFTGKPLVRFNAGTNPTYSSGHLELNDAGSGNPVVLGFHREGLSEVSLVHKAGSDGLHVMSGGALDGSLNGIRASEFRLGSGSGVVSHDGNAQVVLRSNHTSGIDIGLLDGDGTTHGGVSAGFHAVGKVGFVNNSAYRLWINPDGSSQASGNMTAVNFYGNGATLTGVALTSSIGAVNGIAPLGGDSKIPAAYLPASGSYSGTWNASTNSPTITSSSGTNGQFYIVGVAGSTSIDGVSSWSVGDQIRFNGSVWQRVPNTNAVTSVAGKVGVVTLDKNDVGLGNVDNTSDINKPISTATQIALNGKSDTSHTHSSATTSVAGFMSASDKTKLDGVATGATANSSDATLLARANHTGTQPYTTITGLATVASSGSASDLTAGTLADARLSSNVALVSSTVSKATPAQLFQSLGTISGAVSVNGASGLHVLATVNGNTTWTFPSPSATEAMALTLELTNGGAYTMTWPSGTRWSGGVAPTLTASGTDVLVFTKAGTNNWRGYLSSKDSR